MSSTSDDKLELLAKNIQTFLNNDTALLIGSGASIPYGLPSMSDLSNEIKNKLGLKYSSNIQWQKFVEELDRSDNLENTLNQIDLDDAIHQDIIWVVWELIESKDKDALSNILLNKNIPSLMNILQKFILKTDPTNIITTNYDRLVEYACELSGGKINSGFTGDNIGRFIQSQNSSSKRMVNIFKVHGSINWFKHKKNHNIISASYFNKSKLWAEYDPQIVTPGNGKYKETHYDPFRTVMSKADDAIRKSQAYLCIGYGFNDEHIQQIIIEENRINKKPIVIVTKSITDRIKNLFIDDKADDYLILVEGDSGKGCKVHYSSGKNESFDESYWRLDNFYKLWFQ